MVAYVWVGECGCVGEEERKEGVGFGLVGAGDPLGRVRCHKILAGGPQGRLLLQVRGKTEQIGLGLQSQGEDGRIGGMGVGVGVGDRRRAHTHTETQTLATRLVGGRGEQGRSRVCGVSCRLVSCRVVESSRAGRGVQAVVVGWR